MSASPSSSDAKGASPKEAKSTDARPPREDRSPVKPAKAKAASAANGDPAYLNFPLPPRPADEDGTLVRLDCFTKQWYRVSQDERIPTPRRPLDPPLPPVHPDVEIRRAELRKQLEREMGLLCAAVDVPIGKPRGLFDRWVWTQLCVQPEEADPLLPFSATDEEPRFEAELADFGVSTADSRSILKMIAAKSTEACHELRAFAKEASDEHEVVLKPHPYRRNAVEVTYKTQTLELNEEHLRKLKRLYAHKIDPENDAEFRRDLFCLLQRYATLGGDAYQAAVPPHVFRHFRHSMGVEMECFASPLNCFFNRLCSAFPDTDARFSSIGSFFDFTPDEGSFEANPPFTEVSMQRMAEHIDFLLARTNKALSFLVVVPRWDDDASPMWRMMSASPFLVRRIDIPKRAHQYCKGYQHSVESKFWVASHETCVFILQNDAGKQKYVADDQFADKLLETWRTNSDNQHLPARGNGGDAGHGRKRRDDYDHDNDRGGQRKRRRDDDRNAERGDYRQNRRRDDDRGGRRGDYRDGRRGDSRDRRRDDNHDRRRDDSRDGRRSDRRHSHGDRNERRRGDRNSRRN